MHDQTRHPPQGGLGVHLNITHGSLCAVQGPKLDTQRITAEFAEIIAHPCRREFVAFAHGLRTEEPRFTPRHSLLPLHRPVRSSRVAVGRGRVRREKLFPPQAVGDQASSIALLDLCNRGEENHILDTQPITASFG